VAKIDWVVVWSSSLSGVPDMPGLEREPSRSNRHREFDLEALDEF
jgi:hypothetical protein